MFVFLPEHKPLENKRGHSVSIPSRKHQEKGEDYRHQQCRTELLQTSKHWKIYWKTSTTFIHSYSSLVFSLHLATEISIHSLNPLLFTSELGAGNLLDETLSIILFLFFLSSPHFSAISYGVFSQLPVFSTGPRAVCSYIEYECSSFMGRRRKLLLHFSFCPCCKTDVWLPSCSQHSDNPQYMWKGCWTPITRNCKASSLLSFVEIWLQMFLRKKKDKKRQKKEKIIHPNFMLLMLLIWLWICQVCVMNIVLSLHMFSNKVGRLKFYPPWPTWEFQSCFYSCFLIKFTKGLIAHCKLTMDRRKYIE